MLEQLRIVNFKAHRKLVLDFDPQITTIVGPNDLGKSAILQALRWVCLNKPSGEDFRTWDTKNTKARLSVDGSTIRRCRGSSGNYYSLDGRDYHALGASGVPASISDLLNITDINFQGQIESAFWFMEPPSQVAKNLNQIINLGIIDKTLEAMASNVRRAKTVVSVSEERLTSARERKKELTWIPEFDEKLQLLEQSELQIEQLKDRRRVLNDLIDKVQQVDQTIRRLRPAKDKGHDLLEKAGNLLELSKQRKHLSNILTELDSHEDNYIELTKKITKLRSKLKEVKECPACHNPL